MPINGHPRSAAPIPKSNRVSRANSGNSLMVPPARFELNQRGLPLRHSRTFFTFGYQAHTIRTMLRVMRKHEIELVVDVRQNPISRKPGFSKTRFATLLSKQGIEYLHYPC